MTFGWQSPCSAWGALDARSTQQQLTIDRAIEFGLWRWFTFLLGVKAFIFLFFVIAIYWFIRCHRTLLLQLVHLLQQVCLLCLPWIWIYLCLCVRRNAKELFKLLLRLSLPYRHLFLDSSCVILGVLVGIWLIIQVCELFVILDRISDNTLVGNFSEVIRRLFIVLLYRMELWDCDALL